MDTLPHNCIIDTCVSTNDRVKQLGQSEAPHGTWLSAKTQKKGRGRQGRVWESREGNLFFSVLARLENQKLWPWIPLNVANAAHGALTSLFPAIKVKIKWPNDLFLNGKKFGGILCESVFSSRNPFIVIGVGMNCENHPAFIQTRSGYPTTHLKNELPNEIRLSTEIIIPVLLKEILNHLEELRTQGPTATRMRYQEHCLYGAGSRIQIGNPGRYATIVDLGPSGELILREEDGSMTRAYSEDVTAPGN